MTAKLNRETATEYALRMMLDLGYLMPRVTRYEMESEDGYAIAHVEVHYFCPWSWEWFFATWSVWIEDGKLYGEWREWPQSHLIAHSERDHYNVHVHSSPNPHRIGTS